MFDPTNLAAITHANGFTLWHYRTQDSLVDVLEDGYFNKAANFVKVADKVIVHAEAGKLLSRVCEMFIAHNRDGEVWTAIPDNETASVVTTNPSEYAL